MKAGWELKPLGEVYDVRDGTHDSPKYQEDGYPLITSKNLKPNGLSFEKVKLISEEDFTSINRRSAVHKGDLLFAMIGTIGNPTIVETEANFAIKNVALFKVPEGQDVSFLRYYLETVFVKVKMAKEAKGVTQKFVGLGYLRGFPISLPPLEEQKRIVAVLDGAFDALTRARAHVEANLLNARELFEGHLASIFSDPPTSWKVEKLQNYCKKITVGHVGSMSKRYTATGIPFLRSQNVRPFHIDLDGVKYIDKEFNSELGKSELRPGDVAIVRTGYPGTAAVIPEDLLLANCSDLVIARTSDALEPQFLVMFLNSDFGKKMVARNSVGAAQKHFNVTAAKNVVFPAPLVSEQLKIISQIMKLKKKCKNLEAHYQQKLTDLDDLRQSLLQKAFAGELT